ncbi:hypothetical protein B0H13DRAFT_2323843 [Mycena leptocephala]|nr:hypothetical protein B0H13DRAFT_2323843 [Mycena leptocephala]
MHFLVLPFVVVFLILEDQPGLNTFHDTLFEKTNSNEYGDLFPEDITEPSVHTIHYPNTLSNRSAQDLRDTEPDPTPPRHRKSIQIKTEAKTETLKVIYQRTFLLTSVCMHTSTSLSIRIPPPTVVEEEEITLDDFQCLAHTVNPSSY